MNRRSLKGFVQHCNRCCCVPAALEPVVDAAVFLGSAVAGGAAGRERDPGVQSHRRHPQERSRVSTPGGAGPRRGPAEPLHRSGHSASLFKPIRITPQQSKGVVQYINSRAITSYSSRFDVK